MSTFRAKFVMKLIDLNFDRFDSYRPHVERNAFLRIFYPLSCYGYTNIGQGIFYLYFTNGDSWKNIIERKDITNHTSRGKDVHVNYDIVSPPPKHILQIEGHHLQIEQSMDHINSSPEKCFSQAEKFQALNSKINDIVAQNYDLTPENSSVENSNELNNHVTFDSHQEADYLKTSFRSAKFSSFTGSEGNIAATENQLLSNAPDVIDQLLPLQCLKLIFENSFIDLNEYETRKAQLVDRITGTRKIDPFPIGYTSNVDVVSTVDSRAIIRKRSRLYE